MVFRKWSWGYPRNQSISVLEDTLLPTAWAQYGLKPTSSVQDRSPIHTSRVVMEWFAEKSEFDLLPWPAKGADFTSHQKFVERDGL